MTRSILNGLVPQIMSAYGMEVRTPDASCDASMCRTTDGGDGFDCWADGVWEQFACADGYEAVKTGEFSDDSYEITCCPPSVDAASKMVWMYRCFQMMICGAMHRSTCRVLRLRGLTGWT